MNKGVLLFAWRYDDSLRCRYYAQNHKRFQGLDDFLHIFFQQAKKNRHLAVLVGLRLVKFAQFVGRQPRQ